MNHLHTSDHHAANLTHDHLTDGYISRTFGPRVAGGYIAHLFGVDAATIQAIRQTDAFYVFNPPPYYIPPALSVHGRDAWLLDFAVINKSGGSIVPQQLWSPQGQGDRRRYVDQMQFRLPMFFVNMNGDLGVPVTNAAAGVMQLRGVNLPPQLADKNTIKIRINVCIHFLPAHSPSLTVCTVAVAGLSALRIPGPTEGSDPCKESHSSREVCQACGKSHKTIFIGVFVPHVAMNLEIDQFLGLRASSCPRTDRALDCWTWQYHLR